MVDDATGMGWSVLMPTKGDTVTAVQRKVKELAAKGMPVSVIRCDDATENIRIRTEFQNSGDPALLAVQFVQYTLFPAQTLSDLGE